MTTYKTSAAVKEKIDKIKEQIKNVQDAVIRFENIIMSNGKQNNSFTWVADNMDTYWSVETSSGESTAHQNIKDNLYAIASEFSTPSGDYSGSNILSTTAKVLEAAQAKISELQAEYERLYAEELARKMGN